MWRVAATRLVRRQVYEVFLDGRPAVRGVDVTEIVDLHEESRFERRRSCGEGCSG